MIQVKSINLQVFKIFWSQHRAQVPPSNPSLLDLSVISNESNNKCENNIQGLLTSTQAFSVEIGW